MVCEPAWKATIATLPPLGPIALASCVGGELGALVLFVAISGTPLGCGSVPESIVDDLDPAPLVRSSMTSIIAVESVAAYTSPLTPWPM